MYSISNNRPGPLIQLAILFGLASVCSILCLSLIKLGLPVLFDIDDPVKFLSSPESQQQNIRASLFIQSLVSSWGMFFLPSVFFILIMRYNLTNYLKINLAPGFTSLLLAVAIIITAGVFLNVLVTASKLIDLPESLAFLRNSQAQKEKLFDSYFADSSLTNLAILLLVLAVFPAIAEEFFFRGIVQQIFWNFSASAGLSIAITGLTFSLMHLEFDNFLGIWFMGIVLGMIFHYSQNLWLSITAHFFNNSLMILLKYSYTRKLLVDDLSENSNYPFYVSLVSGVIMMLLIFIFMKKNNYKTLNTTNE